MTGSIARSPLFHKGLTAFTPNGTALPLAKPSIADSVARETERSDNKVLPPHHAKGASNGRP